MKELTQVDINLMRLKKLKFKAYDNYTKSDLIFLEEQGKHNGVGPSKWCKWLRIITTWLFTFLEWRRHDDSFWKQTGFHKANYGILKYSHISLADEYRQICEEKGSKRLYKICKYHVTLDFKIRIITLAYNAVESKAGLKAYNNS